MTDLESKKIELRAGWYTGTSHVLEWRFNPDQDLEYMQHKKYLFGLIKLNCKSKVNTKWHRPVWFFNGGISHYYDENDHYNWHPIWCNGIEDLNEFRSKIHTYGDLCNFIHEHNVKSKAEYKINRANFLAQKKPIY